MDRHTVDESHDERHKQSAKAFSVRELLRDRQALLVHFNTPQSSHHTGFPEDLRNAKSLKGQHLAFSTIRAYDRGPSQVELIEDANAGGSVGLVVDIQDEGSVLRVCPFDGGTDPSGEGFGEDLSEDACVKSIDQRNDDERSGNNEWRVRNYKPLGIFVFLPAIVFTPLTGDRSSEFCEIVTAFPSDRIFRCKDGGFQEYDRKASEWMGVAYSEIVPD